jgi:hypothetical protein
MEGGGWDVGLYRRWMISQPFFCCNCFISYALDVLVGVLAQAHLYLRLRLTTGIGTKLSEDAVISIQYNTGRRYTTTSEEQIFDGQRRLL